MIVDENGNKRYDWEDRVIFNPFVKNVIAHGMVMNWAIENKSYWILDIIASAQVLKKVKAEHFQFWKVTVNSDKSCSIICTDGDRGGGPITLYKQKVIYTDLKSDLYVYCITEGDWYDDTVGYVNERRVIVFPEDR